jgi:replicative DNA helicase
MKKVGSKSLLNLCNDFKDNPDPFDAIDESISTLTSLRSQFKKEHAVSMATIAGEAFDEIDRIRNGKSMSIPFGFTDIDHTTGGMEGGDLIVIAGLEKRGKCLGINTPILMFDGSVKMVQDIAMGDMLMGEDSTPRKVLSTTSGIDELFRVDLSRFSGSYVCNKEHIMVLKRNHYAKTIKRGLRRNGEIIEVSVGEYVKRATKGFKEHYRQFKVGVDFPEKELPIDPYLLGVWLGDGDSAGPKITSADKPIIDWLENYAKQCGYIFKNIKTPSKARSLSLTLKRGSKNSLQSILRRIGVLNNKHIPDNYLVNSRQNRLNLLAGLIDTDGYAGSGYRVSFTNKNKFMCEQIIFLARSLGYHSGQLVVKHSKKYNRDYYEVSISGNIQEIPVLLKRKILPKSKKPKDSCRYDCDVTPLGVGRYYGFTLSGNGRFLLGDFTVSHNTTLALQTVFHAAKMGYPCLFFSAEMKRKQILFRYALMVEEISWIDAKRNVLSQDDWERIAKRINIMASYPIYVRDSVLTITDIYSDSERFVKERGVKLIAVDYIQRVVPITKKSTDNREREISAISSGLKNIAMQFDVPVIALSQLNKDLRARESMAIEQDMDKMITIDSPENDIVCAEGRGLEVGIKIRQRMGMSGGFNDNKLYYDKLNGSWKNYLGGTSLVPVEQPIKHEKEDLF